MSQTNNTGDVLKPVIFITLAFWYLAGIAIAKGGWAVFFSLFTPYGMYLVVYNLLTKAGLVF